jgi:FKBP-type peptidyl-prolyl cis-trans isomerase
MPRKIGLVLVAAALTLQCHAGGAAPETEDEQLAYLMGALTGRRMPLAMLGLNESELASMIQGFADATNGRPLAVSLEQMGPRLRGFQERRRGEVNRKELERSGAFLAEKEGQAGVVKSTTGLLYEQIEEGTGESPAETDTVRVHYTGTLRDGRTFDSSLLRGSPAEFRLNGVIPCWTEALQTMKVGGKRRLYCPASIAYGERGSPPMIRPGAALVFEVELLEIKQE